MKKNEISSKFNGHLVAALAEGFAPCMTELRGTYSGVFGTQLVLAKGNERIIMWMEEDHDYSGNDVPDTVSLFVSRFMLGKGETTEFNYMWPENWKEHLVDKMTVYEVSSRRDGWYVDSAEEAIRAKGIRRTRSGNRYRYNPSYREYEVTDRLLSIARRLKGFKTVKRDNLRVSKHNNNWVFMNKMSNRKVRLGA